MSEINFCNTKEQLNHLGEVVTGKVDGSPSGADIETSTLPYTGQVRKTLPALEAEYEQSITNKEVEADAAIDEYRLLFKGDYAAGITLDSKFEYINYNGESYFATNPPHTTTATTPDADGNLFAGGYTTIETVANKIGNPNLLSNSNFLTPSPEAITHPNATPESYVAGTQIFSGVYAGSSGVTVTLIDGRVNCSAGSYEYRVANTNGLDRVPVFTSSVSDYDGNPVTVGVSHALVSDEYIVTVTPAAGDVFSVKFEQGDIATRHDVGSISASNLSEYTNAAYDNITDMFEGSPLANAIGDICNVYGSIFLKESEALPVTISNYRALNNPSIFAFGGKVDGVTDDTAAFLALVNSGFEVVELGQGTMIVDEFLATLSNNLTIKANGCVIKSASSSPVQYAAYFTVGGYNFRIDDASFDADNKAFQCLRIQNESNADLKDVELNNVKAFNAYRSSQSFQGGDGIFVRGGFRRVIINNPEVKSVKMASGAGITGSEGVSGITVVQNFAQTLMPRYVEINNPYVEDVYSEDNTYTSDQDGAKLLGIDTQFMEEGSCRINGGTFKNCWGRSLKFQRPDAVVTGTTFIRTQGNATGVGNSEVDFQRGGGTVRDIICKYTNFNPVTIVNTYQNQYDTYKFLVDGISVSLEGTSLTQVVQRFSQATADKPVPLIIKNIDVIGRTARVLRYLTQNSSISDEKEQAYLENIYFEDADFLAQVYGNDTGQRVDLYLRNVNTTGASVALIDEGEFSNAVEARVYQDYIRGFSTCTDNFFTAVLTAQSGAVTLNPSENRLHYMRKGRVVSVYGQVRVLSVSAPTGTLSLQLPLPSQRGTQTSSVVSSNIVVGDSVSKNANDFTMSLDFDSDTAFIRDISGNSADGSAVAQQMKNNTRLYISFQYVAEDDY